MNILHTKEPSVVQKADSWQMFNRISAKYDALNHILSFGLDLRWRKLLIRYVPQRSGLFLVDLATGTADVVLTLVKRCPQITKVIGIDLAEKMLAIGRTKVDKAGLEGKIELKSGDANQIPIPAGQADIVTMAFGIRNVEDPVIVMREMHRILSNSGRAVILEFSLPKNPVLRFFHLSYLKIGVPFIGGLLSGDWAAYRYLNRTIEQFPYGDEFCQLLSSAGFQRVRQTPLLFGVATIYQADKDSKQ